MAQDKSVARKAYWRANLGLMGVLLAIWFAVSFGFGIVLRPWLDLVSLGGAPLGFWFAQQGSILTFIVLIFYYAWAMNRLEARFADRLGSDDMPAPDFTAADAATPDATPDATAGDPAMQEDAP